MTAAGLPALRYAHLAALTDDRGLFEHALGEQPRPEHGYCLDDAARGLLIVLREPEQDDELQRLAEIYLRFVESAITPDGAHNRMDTSGAWTDRPGLGDWWGRALWALGAAAATAPLPFTRRRAARAFGELAEQRSPYLRASAFAALGAGELLRAEPGHAVARRLLVDALVAIPTEPLAEWGWLEPRLGYANASLAEAVMLGGVVMTDAALVSRGLDLLGALLAIETHDGRLSVTGSQGRAPSDRSPLFDQQPIEVAAIADACARAFDITHAARWLDGVRLAASWFHGVNDSRTAMFDPLTGAGYDGLEPDGRNDNRGAESTLAALSTLQQARRLGVSVAASAQASAKGQQPSAAR